MRRKWIPYTRTSIGWKIWVMVKFSSDSDLNHIRTYKPLPRLLLQSLPNVRLCLSHRGQSGGRDPRPQDHRVPRPRRAVLLDHRRPGHQEAAHLGVRQTQPQQHRALQEEAHLVCGAGIRRRMVSSGGVLHFPSDSSWLRLDPLLPFSCRDDPRFPTVRGVLRRGMTVDGLKQFIAAQVQYFWFYFVSLFDRPENVSPSYSDVSLSGQLESLHCISMSFLWISFTSKNNLWPLLCRVDRGQWWTWSGTKSGPSIKR